MAADPWTHRRQICEERIRAIGGTPCDDIFCQEQIGPIWQYIHAYCTCQPPYENGCHPNRTPGCCVTSQSPIPVLDKNCYCCCSNMMDDVAVAYNATSYKPITDFRVGDPVYVASDASLRTWSQRPVLFSSGAGALGDDQNMFRVLYGSSEHNDALVVSRAQPFMTVAGGLKPAAALIPGHDALVTGVGEPYPVLAVEPGAASLGFHHIATSTTPATSMDGHLVLAKNVVCGDWALQVALDTGSLT
jgi:hypothetical protein